MLAASVRGPSNQVLSEVLRAGRASTARLSPLSTPDSILMCYGALSLALLNEIRMWCVVREGRCRKKGLFFP